MRILFIHERFGAFGGAEANILATATELKERGHAVGIVHGPATGKGHDAWSDVFQSRFLLGPGNESVVSASKTFRPDVIYVHKMSDLKVLEALLDSDIAIARMVHDHDLYCMRSYKYNYFTRAICERPASPACLFPCGAFMTRSRLRI